MKILDDLERLSKAADKAGLNTEEMTDFDILATPKVVLALVDAVRALETIASPLETDDFGWSTKMARDALKKLEKDTL